jgi:hypothetical protein
MSEFIALRIMKAKDVGGTEAGQTKYRGYFIITSLYLAYKEDCDTILISENYGDCIVTE